MYETKSNGTLRLTAELVPSTCWYSNLRNQVPVGIWDDIRRKAYQDANHQCAICEAEGKLFCHEVWEYNDEQKIQALTKFMALCEMCHMVKHLGYARIRDSRGDLDFSEVVEHFLKVNGCSREMFSQHQEQVFQIWADRSKFKWTCDLREWSGVVKGGKDA